jgi:predicted O-methyltransferase YrrM
MNGAPVSTSQAALEGLRALYPAPSWVQGATPLADAEFLLEMVCAEQPSVIVELGVAAGVSSAVLLYSLDTLPGEALRTLHSCDPIAACYFDGTRPTGAAANVMYRNARSRWVLDIGGDAVRVARTRGPAGVDLTFIDGNHYHPWPLLDLLHMTAVARRGSWVILHDINLPIVAPKCPVWGAKWLFDEWPFEKLTPSRRHANIGAVKLPDDVTRLIPLAADLLERHWEFPPSLAAASLPEPFAPLNSLLTQRLAQTA